jgi:serine/threonine protein kinase
MNPARLHKIEELFASTLSRPVAERDAFLEDSCEGDEALRREVDALLAADNDAEGSLQKIANAMAADWATSHDDGDFIGQIVGRYKIIAPLGAGGMGEVFLAEDLTLNRKAAIKFLPRKSTRDADRLRRFEQEARAASALNHPHIVTIYEVGEWNGSNFIASEFVEGETLSERSKKARLPLADVLDIGCQTAGALTAAHEAGIVHRDIKPANIIRRRDGYIKLLDFGIAKLSSTTPQLDVTEPGRVMGTINYMSPEQALGKPLDHRTDIFSLGVVLYEIATGRRLFDGESEASVYDHILNRAPARMREIDPELPAEFELVVRRALEKDPDCRYQSAADLRDDLKRLAQGTGETDAARLAASAQRTLRRSQTLRIAGTLAAAALVISAAFFFGSRSSVSNHVAPAVKEFSRKSVAVLPFENLTPTPENETFTGGMQDQILTDLSKVADLKTISRTSVSRYRAGEPRNLPEIGRQLGVTYLLEGSVQRADEKIRVHAQLIDAANNKQVWAETYDRRLADFFAIQGEIAKAIAGQLSAQLSPVQKAEIEQRPTHDLEAFSLYTRGKTLVFAAASGDDPEANFHAGVRLLDEAAQRDPNFLSPYVTLAQAHASIALYGIDNSPARLALAQAAVAAARGISPQSGDTHLAAAWTLYAALDHEGARKELDLARGSLPNEPRVFEMSGYINRRQGRWKECTQDFERVVELDPLNATALQQLGETYEVLHRYADWAATLDRAIALRPDGADLRFTRADVDLEARADTHRLRAEIETAEREGKKAPVDYRLVLAFPERDLIGIANALADLGDRRYGYDWARFSRAFGEGLLARMSGDERAAHRAFAADRIAQLTLVEAQPNYGPVISMLGLIEAGLGNKDEALRLGRRAAELTPIEKDFIRGPYMIAHLAIIAAWVGEKDLALEQMRLFEKLTPAGFHYGRLKLDPMWDPLRGDPRFEAIAAAHAP